jgi:hypothetical protein
VLSSGLCDRFRCEREFVFVKNVNERRDMLVRQPNGAYERPLKRKKLAGSRKGP